MRNRCIVIPVYKQELDYYESVALKQIRRIFIEEEIVFITHPELVADYIQDNRCEYFSKEDFESVHTYSRLMMDVNFYKRFIKYKYILICQLDVFVFKNDLDYFCDRDYDYIGAPWLDGAIYYKNMDRAAYFVGNGGFSLRKVSSFINLLEKVVPDYEVNEDLFFASCSGDDFQIAPVKEALMFSFEMNIQRCFEMNNNQLPFAAHAFMKFDLQYLKKYIDSFGYDIKCEAVQEDFACVKYDNSFLNCEKNKIYEYFHSKLVAYKKRDIVIWGAGNNGKKVGYLLQKAGFEFSYVDSQVFAQEKYLWEKEIKSTDSISNNSLVVVSPLKGETIIEYLTEHGYKYIEYLKLNNDLKCGYL